MTRAEAGDGGRAWKSSERIISAGRPWYSPPRPPAAHIRPSAPTIPPPSWHHNTTSEGATDRAELLRVGAVAGETLRASVAAGNTGAVWLCGCVSHLLVSLLRISLRHDLSPQEWVGEDHGDESSRGAEAEGGEERQLPATREHAQLQLRATIAVDQGQDQS